MIQAVIFDMDGLLIDSEPLWRKAETEEFATVGFTLTDAMCETTVGLRVNEVIRHWYAKQPWPNPDFQRLEVAILHRMNGLIREQGKLLNGAAGIVEFFRSRKIPVAIASSSYRILIDAFLNTFGFRGMFDVVHSAEAEEYGKPHPAVFLNTAKQLQADPTQCLVFEDSPNGVLAARAARMKVVAVPDPSARSRSEFAVAHCVMNSLLEWSDDQWRSLQ